MTRRTFAIFTVLCFSQYVYKPEFNCNINFDIFYVNVTWNKAPPIGGPIIIPKPEKNSNVPYDTHHNTNQYIALQSHLTKNLLKFGKYGGSIQNVFLHTVIHNIYRVSQIKRTNDLFVYNFAKYWALADFQNSFIYDSARSLQ